MDKDKLYLEHIVQAVAKIQRYTENLSLDDFKKSDLVQDGVMRELEIVGEAARHLSEKTRAQYPTIPWFKISGMRNKLVHEYFGVDVDVVWKTVTEDVRHLHEKLGGKENIP